MPYIVQARQCSRLTYLFVSLSTTCSVLVLFAGCNDGRPKRAPISGQVLIDGQPLTHGSVSFMPTQGRPAGANLDENGRFVLTCYEKDDGAVLGEYRVAISGVEYLGETAQRWHAPKRYADMNKSGLTLTVDGPRDDLKFELTWGGGKPFVERF